MAKKKVTVSAAKLRTSMAHLGLKLPHGYDIVKRKKRPAAKKRKAVKKRKTTRRR